MPPTPHPSATDVRREHHLAEVLEVHLVTDARPRRDDAEIAQRRLPPAQELIALEVPLILEVRVDQHRRIAAVFVDLHRMVDHEVHRLQRVDARRVAAERRNRVAHRGEVHHAGDPGEVLQQHARGAEGDFLLDLSLHVPRGQRLDVAFPDEAAVLVAEEVFQQDPQRKREGPGARTRQPVDGVDAVDDVALPRHVERGAGAKGIDVGHGQSRTGAAPFDGRRGGLSHCRGARRARQADGKASTKPSSAPPYVSRLACAGGAPGEYSRP